MNSASLALQQQFMAVDQVIQENCQMMSGMEEHCPIPPPFLDGGNIFACFLNQAFATIIILHLDKRGVIFWLYSGVTSLACTSLS
jgi:hypothetical protein